MHGEKSMKKKNLAIFALCCQKQMESKAQLVSRKCLYYNGTGNKLILTFIEICHGFPTSGIFASLRCEKQKLNGIFCLFCFSDSWAGWMKGVVENFLGGCPKEQVKEKWNFIFK